MYDQVLHLLHQESCKFSASLKRSRPTLCPLYVREEIVFELEMLIKLVEYTQYYIAHNSSILFGYFGFMLRTVHKILKIYRADIWQKMRKFCNRMLTKLRQIRPVSAPDTVSHVIIMGKYSEVFVAYTCALKTAFSPAEIIDANCDLSEGVNTITPLIWDVYTGANKTERLTKTPPAISWDEEKCTCLLTCVNTYAICVHLVCECTCGIHASRKDKCFLSRDALRLLVQDYFLAVNTLIDTLITLPNFSKIQHILAHRRCHQFDYHLIDSGSVTGCFIVMERMPRLLAAATNTSVARLRHMAKIVNTTLNIYLSDPEFSGQFARLYVHYCEILTGIKRGKCNAEIIAALEKSRDKYRNVSAVSAAVAN